MTSKHQQEAESLARLLRAKNASGGKRLNVFRARPNSKKSIKGRASRNQGSWKSKGYSPPVLFKAHRGGVGADEYTQKSPGSKLIDTNMLSLNSKDRAVEWNIDQLRHPAVKNLFMHVSFSRPKGCQLFEKQWKEFSHLFREEIRSTGQYQLTRHSNTDHDHVHLVFSLAQSDGTVLSTSHNFYKWRAAVRRVEQKMGLKPTPIQVDTESPSTSDRQVSSNRRAARRGTQKNHIDPVRVAAVLADVIDFDQARQRLTSIDIETQISMHKNGETRGLLMRQAGATEWLAATSISRELSLPKLQAQIEKNRIAHAHAQATNLARQRVRITPTQSAPRHRG